MMIKLINLIICKINFNSTKSIYYLCYTGKINSNVICKL